MKRNRNMISRIRRLLLVLLFLILLASLGAAVFLPVTALAAAT